jgi:hypothetical protein
MYIFKKKQHIILFALIETKKKRREKNYMLNDGMAMYVKCDDDERSPSFFSSPSFLIAFRCSLYFYVCALAWATSMHIIISCFVRSEEKNDRERDREGKEIVLFLANQEYALSRFFFSSENRTEKEKLN